MGNLVKTVPRYSVDPLPCTCSMAEFGDFSTMHAHKNADYVDQNFYPSNPSGLYCATFVKDDSPSDVMYDVLNETFTRILRTKWRPSKDGTRMLRFCVFKEKE